MPASFPQPGGPRRGRGRLQAVRARCLSDQSLRTRERLTLHQDKDEHDLSADRLCLARHSGSVPVRRVEESRQIDGVRLTHGDVVVWGGPARLRYHGVVPLKEGHHPLVGGRRINLTFRKARERSVAGLLSTSFQSASSDQASARMIAGLPTTTLAGGITDHDAACPDDAVVADRHAPEE